MKTMPKTLRPDYRYVKIKIESDEPKNFSETVKLVKTVVKDFSGEQGLAKTDPWLVKDHFDFENQQAVVRIRRDSENLFRASLAASSNRIYSLKASGTQGSL